MNDNSASDLPHKIFYRNLVNLSVGRITPLKPDPVGVLHCLKLQQAQNGGGRQDRDLNLMRHQLLGLRSDINSLHSEHMERYLGLSTYYLSKAAQCPSKSCES